MIDPSLAEAKVMHSKVSGTGPLDWAHLARQTCSQELGEAQRSNKLVQIKALASAQEDHRLSSIIQILFLSLLHWVAVGRSAIPKRILNRTAACQRLFGLG